MVSNPPYVAAGERRCRATSAHEPREALFGGEDGLDVIRRLVAAARGVPFLALEVGAGQAPAVAGRSSAREAGPTWRRSRDLAGHERVVVGRARPARRRPTFARCIADGGVAVFPADTVYGLACDPENGEAVARLYALKGRPPSQPSAVMYFDVGARRSPRCPSSARARARCWRGCSRAA